MKQFEYGKNDVTLNFNESCCEMCGDQFALQTRQNMIAFY